MSPLAGGLQRRLQREAPAQPALGRARRHPPATGQGAAVTSSRRGPDPGRSRGRPMSASTRGVPVARPGRDRAQAARRPARAGLRRAGLRRAGLAAVASATALAVAGCRGAYDLPLPGGAAARGDVYRITVEFRDVLDLVPAVLGQGRPGDRGRRRGDRAQRLDGPGDPAAAQGRAAPRQRRPSKQTSLLGEKYVELAPPSGGQVGGRAGRG